MNPRSIGVTPAILMAKNAPTLGLAALTVVRTIREMMQNVKNGRRFNLDLGLGGPLSLGLDPEVL